jgi:hypothetical protein
MSGSLRDRWETPEGRSLAEEVNGRGAPTFDVMSLTVHLPGALEGARACG